MWFRNNINCDYSTLSPYFSIFFNFVVSIFKGYGLVHVYQGEQQISYTCKIKKSIQGAMNGQK